jgi:hypothetical protein
MNPEARIQESEVLPETYRVPVAREVAEMRIVRSPEFRNQWEVLLLNGNGKPLVHRTGCLTRADACEEAIRLASECEKGESLA